MNILQKIFKEHYEEIEYTLHPRLFHEINKSKNFVPVLSVSCILLAVPSNGIHTFTATSRTDSYDGDSDTEQIVSTTLKKLNTLSEESCMELTATLYTRDRAVMRKLDSLVDNFPDTYKLMNKDEVSKTYSFPKSYVNHRKSRSVIAKRV